MYSIEETMTMKGPKKKQNDVSNFFVPLNWIKVNHMIFTDFFEGRET